MSNNMSLDLLRRLWAKPAITTIAPCTLEDPRCKEMAEKMEAKTKLLKTKFKLQPKVGISAQVAYDPRYWVFLRRSDDR